LNYGDILVQGVQLSYKGIIYRAEYINLRAR